MNTTDDQAAREGTGHEGCATYTCTHTRLVHAINNYHCYGPVNVTEIGQAYNANFGTNHGHIDQTVRLEATSTQLSGLSILQSTRSDISISTSEANSGAGIEPSTYSEGAPSPQRHCHGPSSNTGDMVVIVMGPAGVGKSTFIKQYLSDKAALVSDGLPGSSSYSNADQISHHLHTLPESHPTCPGRRLALIEVPGFDDTIGSEDDVARRVTTHLASMYDAEDKPGVASILYMDSVSQEHASGSRRVSCEALRKVCGLGGTAVGPLVTMATTHWDAAEGEFAGAGTKREDEFRTDFWKDVLDAGATLERVQDYASDPERIINDILRRALQEGAVHVNVGLGMVLSPKIQREIARVCKQLPAESQTGRVLTRTLAGYDPPRRIERVVEEDLENLALPFLFGKLKKELQRNAKRRSGN